MRALLFVVLAAACWGTGTVLSKGAVAELPPLTLLATQLLISAGVLLVAVRRTGQPAGRVDRRLVLLGALNPGLAYALSLIGLTTIAASTSVLIWALEPLLILLAAGVLLDERPGAAVVGLSVAAFMGLVVAVGGEPDGSAIAGIALSVAGVLCCVAYSIATRRWIAQSPSTLAVVAGQEVVALVVVSVVVAASALMGASAIPPSLSVGALGSAIASGVLYYGAAYLLYLDALRILPVSVAAISFFLVPVFGIAAATVAGETLTATQWLGATATIAAVLGVGAVTVRQARAAQPARIRP